MPYLVQESSPLIILISSIMFFDRLSKNRELIAFKNIGLSMWQILIPSVTLVLSYGLILILFLNPLSATLLAISEKLESRFIKKQQNLVMLSNNGLIIKEEDTDQKKIILARSITLTKLMLQDITLLAITKNNEFINRIDAEYGILSNQELQLHKITFYDKNFQESYLEEYVVPTSLSIKHIIDSLAIPEIIPIWEFSRVINKLNKLGLVTTQHQNYYAKLLLKPFFMVIMVFVAACFINLNPRNNKNFKLLVQACVVGFVLQFSTELIANLIISFNIYPLFAYFAPMVLILLSCIFMILTHQEKL